MSGQVLRMYLGSATLLCCPGALQSASRWTNFEIGPDGRSPIGHFPLDANGCRDVLF